GADQTVDRVRDRTESTGQLARQTTERVALQDQGGIGDLVVAGRLPFRVVGRGGSDRTELHARLGEQVVQACLAQQGPEVDVGVLCRVAGAHGDRAVGVDRTGR